METASEENGTQNSVKRTQRRNEITEEIPAPRVPEVGCAKVLGLPQTPGGKNNIPDASWGHRPEEFLEGVVKKGLISVSIS